MESVAHRALRNQDSQFVPILNQRALQGRVTPEFLVQNIRAYAKRFTWQDHDRSVRIG